MYIVKVIESFLELQEKSFWCQQEFMWRTYCLWCIRVMWKLFVTSQGEVWWRISHVFCQETLGLRLMLGCGPYLQCLAGWLIKWEWCQHFKFLIFSHMNCPMLYTWSYTYISLYQEKTRIFFYFRKNNI